MMTDQRNTIEIQNISKSFVVGQQTVSVLKNISLQVTPGDFAIIFGPSGCGKSTLLHTILGLESPSQGKIMVLQEDLYAKPGEDDISQFRKEHVGMIYQQPNWIKSLNVIENVAFPLALVGIEKAVTFEKARKVLDSVGMVNWANYHPSELSSGQQQKIALARGIINDPELIVADEPTGNLDYESGQDVMNILRTLNNTGKTIVMVTHDLEYLEYAKTAVRMFDGTIEGVYQGAKKDELTSDMTIKHKDINAKPNPINTQKEVVLQTPTISTQLPVLDSAKDTIPQQPRILVQHENLEDHK
jgi:putative ABC transport system ATP-binding protein